MHHRIERKATYGTYGRDSTKLIAHNETTQVILSRNNRAKFDCESSYAVHLNYLLDGEWAYVMMQMFSGGRRRLAWRLFHQLVNGARVQRDVSLEKCPNCKTRLKRNGDTLCCDCCGYERRSTRVNDAD